MPPGPGHAVLQEDLQQLLPVSFFDLVGGRALPAPVREFPTDEVV
jgi:hypothetical protein